MRLAIALFALLGLAAAGNLATPALAAADSGYVLAMAQQPGQYSIDIDVDDFGCGVVDQPSLDWHRCRRSCAPRGDHRARGQRRRHDRHQGMTTGGSRRVYCGNRPVATSSSRRARRTRMFGNRHGGLRIARLALRVDQLDIRLRPFPERDVGNPDTSFACSAAAARTRAPARSRPPLRARCGSRNSPAARPPYARREPRPRAPAARAPAPGAAPRRTPAP